MAVFKNGKALYDTDGNVVHCHGAGFIFHDGYYYMFGEDRRGDSLVSCYRSKDLATWEFRNIVLSLNSPSALHYVKTDLRLSAKNAMPFAPPSDAPHRANIERPKVLYCENTGKFVMWMHYENGRDYNAARCAVAVCDTVDGDYTYLGSFNPAGNDSRDCTLFKDEDSTAYFISTSRDNADIAIYRLSEDYLSVDEQVKTLWPGQFREAPVIIKRGKYYFMLTSRCTSWNPNQGGYAYARSITGKWSMIKPLGNETTFNTQPTAALTVGSDALYIGDRWDPADYMNSKIIYLPLTFPEENVCVLSRADEVEITEGGLSHKSEEIKDFRIMLWNCSDYISSDGSNIYSARLSYADDNLLWNMEERDDCLLIRHKASGKYLSGDGIAEAYDENQPRLLWKIQDGPQGKLLVNVYSGKSLSVFGRRVILSDRDDRRFGGYHFVPNC